MAGNTRGKLKEHFAGIHCNFEWAITHCEKALVLIKDHKPELSGSIKALAKGIRAFDELAQGIYSKL